jgi:hypothetical protein
LTRSHSCLSRSFRREAYAPRSPIVLPETSTAEVSSMAASSSRRRRTFSGRGSGPQGLRRPRFSFFRFTCQTARNLAAPSPAGAGERSPLIRHGRGEHKATAFVAGCSVTVQTVRGFATRHRSAAARQRAVYSLSRLALSTPYDSKSALWINAPDRAIFPARTSAKTTANTLPVPPCHLRSGSAALRPHSSAVLYIVVSGTVAMRGSDTFM